MKLIAARIALVLSLLVPVYFAAAALGVKFGVFDWKTGLLVMIVQMGPFVLGGAFVIALIALIFTLVRRPRDGWRMALIALLVPAIGLGYLGYVGQKAASIPPIHDVSTNPEDAPQFSERVMALRAETPDVNPVASLTEPLSASPMYQDKRFSSIAGRSAGEIAREAYPDVRTLNVTQAPLDAAAAVKAEVEAKGWVLVTDEPSQGVVEATAQSFWFGFKDDIAIRVRPATSGSGSAIDMRSTSRVGVSDLGANAARIKSFLEGVAQRLTPGS